MEFITTLVGSLIFMILFVAFAVLVLFVLSAVFALIAPYIKGAIERYLEWFDERTR